MLSIRRESLWENSLELADKIFACQSAAQAREEVALACAADWQGDAMARVPVGKRILRVLVVDDNHDCADSLARLLQMWGNEVQTAYDGAAALKMAVVRQPDVVLLDLTMPEMDGYEVVRQLRQQTAFADTLLIAVTGWTDEVHLQRCGEAGFDRYLIKPIDLAPLEILLFRERRRLADRSAEEVETTKETGGAVMRAVKKAVFRRVGSVVYS